MECSNIKPRLTVTLPKIFTVVRWIILLLIFGLIELYAFQAFKTVNKDKGFIISYLVISVAIVGIIFYGFTQFDRSVGQNRMSLFTLGLMLVIYVPKMLIGLVLFGEDLFRVFCAISRYFVDYDSNTPALPERRKFISQIALGLAAIPFASLIYGIFEGKYNYKVITTKLYFPDLPAAFDGLKITQISDVHSGSFDNAEKIEYAIDLINQQETDLILFTGDIVNTHATEMHPWIDTFKKIKPHKFGKFAVLGNHDYGEYVSWPSQQEKEKNFSDIKKLYGDIDFKLLLNEHTSINKDGEALHIVGVENWGKNFKQAGDLGKAVSGLDRDAFKILMSHDPSHWEYEVKTHPSNVHLTLSGHTHGLQFGIEIPGFFKWSPVQYVYKQWAGLYEHENRKIYVNRGFGFHAYPGRVGIWPEISVFELKKGEKPA